MAEERQAIDWEKLKRLAERLPAILTLIAQIAVLFGDDNKPPPRGSHDCCTPHDVLASALMTAHLAAECCCNEECSDG